MAEPEADFEGVDMVSSEGMSPQVRAVLNQAGAAAAQRLLDLLDGKAFARLKATEQAALIRLALDRAYGPPVQRQATLTLSGQLSDAVSDSLARLSDIDLPETAQHATSADVAGAAAPQAPSDRVDQPKPPNGAQRRSQRLYRI